VIALEWSEQAPIPNHELRIWSSLLPEEVDELRVLADERYVLEIGAAFGYSTIVLASVAGHVWSIDPHDIQPAAGLFNFKGDNLGRYAAGTLPLLREHLRKAGLRSERRRSALAR
jgi:hypothetical protein